MAEILHRVQTVDPVWERIRSEAQDAIRGEPLLGGLIHSSLLHHATMERALAYRFSVKLASSEMSEQILREIADEAYSAAPDLGQAARADVMAVYDRDPACHRFIQPMLYFKGFQAIQAYRVGHWLWLNGRRDMSSLIAALAALDRYSLSAKRPITVPLLRNWLQREFALPSSER